MKTRLLARVFLAAATVLLAHSQPAAAADSDCAIDGGKAHCTSPKVGPYSYNWCATFWNMSTYRTYCEANGGAWDGDIPGCIGLSPVTSEGDAFGRFQAYVNAAHAPICEGPFAAPTTNSYATLNCGNSSGPTYVNGEESFRGTLHGWTGKTTDFGNFGSCGVSWTSSVVITRSRSISCQAGTMPRTLPDGTLRCVSAPPCTTGCTRGNANVGNPIDVSTGAKRQREVDYPSRGTGTLSFERHYNSAGFFALSPREPNSDDYWRHNYSSKLVDHVGNAYVLAVVIRPDGMVRYFDLAGVEIQNHDGAAWRLEKLMTGSTHTGWKLTTAESDVELFDTQGRLASVTTRDGFVTTLAYNSTSGRLETVTDAFGRTLAFAYDTAGQLDTVAGPGSRVYDYNYDAGGRLTGVTYPGGSTRAYLYEDPDWPFLLTGVLDERGQRISTYTYDFSGRAVSTEGADGRNRHTVVWGAENDLTRLANVTDAFGQVTSFQFAKTLGVPRLTHHVKQNVTSASRTFDGNGNPLTLRDGRNVTTQFVFDATRNLETSRTEAHGTALARTITTTWHPTYRLPATITEPSGVTGVNLVTEFTYNSAGVLTKRKLTAGAKSREWNYTVNGRGQVLTADGPRTDVTDVTTFTYYGDTDTCTGCRGQVNTITNALGHVTTLNSYDADSRPTQITDVNGVVTTLTYKPRGWLESRSTSGETTTYDYDAAGNLTKVTLPDGSWIGYAYNANGYLVGLDDSLGNAIDYAYDMMGNRVWEHAYDPNDALKRSHQKLYDQASRLREELGAEGQRTVYTYDQNDNLTQTRDPLFRETTNTYDFLNRLTNILDAASGNTVFTYDAKDRLKTVKDPKLSATTTYNYNGLGDLEGQVSPDTGSTTFTHDTAGNVATQTDARSVTTMYTYDSLSRVSAATVTDGTVTYEYDNTTTGGAYAKGRLTKVTDTSGTTTYVYDALGRVTSKVQTVSATPSSKVFTIGYSYANGRQTGMTYPSGRAVTYGFNAAGQVNSISVDGTSVLAGGEYFPFGPPHKWIWGNGQVMERVYDRDGRIASLTQGPATATYPDLSQVFGYDSLNRLVSANLAAGQTQGFTYDANSNRLTATVNAATTTYTYASTSHKLSSLAGATTRSFTYDNAGNTTMTAGITYVYDGRGRMKSAGATTYLVNGLGQRLKKSTASVDTYFAYDEAGRLIGEYDTSGTPIQETLWLGDLPVAVLKPATPSGFTLFYIWADHLGTPRQISDTSNQSRWEWPHNDPFGNNAPNEDPGGVGTFAFNLRFPGQYFDSETGKHYNYFRDYDPSIGRYIQSDPIGLEGGLNTYAYVGSAPITRFDRYGLYDSRLRGSPGNDPYPGCAGNDASCRSGAPEPPKPGGVLDEGCFVVCVVFGKLAVSAGNTWAINQAANRTRAGSRAHRIANGARAFANNPAAIGIAALYGLDYCWFNCRKDPQQCEPYESFKPTDFFPGGA